MHLKEDWSGTREVKGSTPRPSARVRVLGSRSTIGPEPELACLRGGGDVLSDDISTALLLICCLALGKTTQDSRHYCLRPAYPFDQIPPPVITTTLILLPSRFIILRYNYPDILSTFVPASVSELPRSRDCQNARTARTGPGSMASPNV
jgi:hypothetical protein